MMKKILLSAWLMLLTIIPTGRVTLEAAGASSSGLSANKDKFLGNITTGWGSDMDTNGFRFSDYWNQVTPENATKWESVERTRGRYDWSGADKAANYARQKGFPFKFHTLIWGSQYPKWMDRLSADDQYKAIEKWMDEVKKHYPDLEMIDVVNEAIAGHAPAPYKAALGGDGKTGYDWIIKAFEMAHERWPNAILIYNDYNTFQWNTDQFIDLVRTIRDAGAPIDAYGCQSHDLGGVDKTRFAAAMKKIQDALRMPMYITEYDIGDTNDANQKWNFQQHFPVMWEADYCAGVTLWGWIYGQTWINNDQTGEKGISGIIRNGQERSALKWLREYMQTEKAIKAKSPFPGMVKEASLYVKPSAIVTTRGERLNIKAEASMRTKTVDHVDLYINNTLVKTMTAAPFEAEYTPEKEGKYEIKAIATTTDGTAYQRLSGFTVCAPREVYNGVKACIDSRDADPAHRKTAIEFLRKEDPRAYADFNFRFGSLVYLGYPGGKGNAAREYLVNAIDSGGLEGNRLAAAVMMYELADAYRKKIKSDSTSRKKGIEIGEGCGQYWNTLEKLAGNLESLYAETGNIGYPVRVCDEVANELDRHTVSYQYAGISAERLRNTLLNVRSFMAEMSEKAQSLSPAAQEEIARVDHNVSLAEERLNSQDAGGTNGY